MDGVTKEDMIGFFQQKKTYEEISRILQNRYPGKRGFSTKSIQRFCKENNVSPRTSNNELQVMVSAAVSEVRSFRRSKSFAFIIYIYTNHSLSIFSIIIGWTNLW